jgi:hypothetical protein
MAIIKDEKVVCHWTAQGDDLRIQKIEYYLILTLAAAGSARKNLAQRLPDNSHFAIITS